MPATLIKSLEQTLKAYPKEAAALLQCYLGLNRPFLLRSDLVDQAGAFCACEAGSALRLSPLANAIRAAQEAVIAYPAFYLAIRPDIAKWQFLRINAEDLSCEEVSASAFLEAKEALVEPGKPRPDWTLEIDFGPFEREFPKMERARSIGRGVEFLNRYLSSRLFAEKEQGNRRLLEFLRLHHYRGKQLMLGREVDSLEKLSRALSEAQNFLETLDPKTNQTEFQEALREKGFEPGWGRTARQALETMSLLAEILEAPDPLSLERFLGSIPMIFNLVILSPHGYFGQSNVLGLPDTGGQVVYILDQVRALEKEMRRFCFEQGLDIEPQILIFTRLIPEAEGTTCNRPEEPVRGTRNVRIIRVPFRTPDGAAVPHWISRFKVWPYLERYAREVCVEIEQRLGGRPDLIIGNYSDGNLTATLAARWMGVTQCNIAHALEKTKYLYSDLYWKDHEPEHHFSCQFTADLIAMNAADFIIASTYQEIAGTRETIGQYESYNHFTMPGLYRTLRGVSPFDPKFNIVSPGADPQFFFPYTQRRKGSRKAREEVERLVFGPPGTEALGGWSEPDKPPVFAMSRLDRIKNMAGLAAWYGRSAELRREANLLLVGGQFDPERSKDAEEREQIEKLRALIEEHNLEGQVRWITMQTDKARVGELYRLVARRRGVFVQPALFEAFGLTVIEAMSCGLPVFATRYGGPLEIIEHGRSGFHIDPNHGDEAAQAIAEFLWESRRDPAWWKRISDGALSRVAERYTWSLYARRLLTLSRVYGFWKYISRIEREETRRYLDMFYGLMYRPLAAKAGE